MIEKKTSDDETKDSRPFSQRHPRWNTFFAFLLLILLILGALYVLIFLAKKFLAFIDAVVSATSKTDTVIIVALITATVTIISGVILKIIDFNQRRREYLSQQREEPYAEFINVYFKMHEKVSKNEKYSASEMFEDIQKFQKKLMLWGSNRVIKAWITFREKANYDNENILLYMENILYAIRKDMGYKNLGKGKLLSISINSYFHTK